MIPFHNPICAESCANGIPGVAFFFAPGTVNTFGCACVPKLINDPRTIIPAPLVALIVTPACTIKVSPLLIYTSQPSVYVLPVSITPLIEPHNGAASLTVEPAGKTYLYMVHNSNIETINPDCYITVLQHEPNGKKIFIKPPEINNEDN